MDNYGIPSEMFFKYVANGDTFIIHYQLSIIHSLLVRQHKQRDKKSGPTGKAGPVMLRV